MSRQKKLIAFTLYEGVTPLDVVGPLTVLRKVGPGWPFEMVTVGERVARLETDTPLQLIPAATFADLPGPFAVFVPGGGAATLEAMHNEPLLAYLRSAARTAAVVGSTGNGALVLAAAGLLAGREAAIHWAYRGQLEGAGARCTRERWRDDRKFLTSAGGTAGIDLMLHLVARFNSESSAKLAQLATEYDPHPPFGGYDSSFAERSYADVV
jgi:transcriptional regulator GlxA family with amidase domain